MDEKKLTPVSVRLPADIKARLEEQAQKENRSLSNMIQTCIIDYLSRHK